MLLMSLSHRYRTITREAHGGSPLERTIDAQARFVYMMARSLSRTEVLLCLEQIQAQRRTNRRTRNQCLQFAAFWALLGLVWILCVPAFAWVAAIMPTVHLLAYLYFGQQRRHLQNLERCLCLLRTL